MQEKLHNCLSGASALFCLGNTVNRNRNARGGYGYICSRLQIILQIKQKETLKSKRRTEVLIEIKENLNVCLSGEKQYSI